MTAFRVNIPALRECKPEGMFLNGTPWDGEEYACIPHSSVLALVEVAQAARVFVAETLAENPFAGYAFEALREDLAALDFSAAGPGSTTP